MFFKKKLEDLIDQKRKVKIQGVEFIIRKINPLDYMEGAKVLIAFYDEYKRKNESGGGDQVDQSKFNSAKAHMKDVILAAVVSPKIARKENEQGFFVDRLFINFGLVDELYAQIMLFTTGKKKL